MGLSAHIEQNRSFTGCLQCTVLQNSFLHGRFCGGVVSESNNLVQGTFIAIILILYSQLCHSGYQLSVDQTLYCDWYGLYSTMQQPTVLKSPSLHASDSNNVQHTFPLWGFSFKHSSRYDTKPVASGTLSP